MFMFDEERCTARPKIAIVRDFIGAVNCNPFLRDLKREDLLERMADIASDVEMAAETLSELAGVENIVMDEEAGGPRSFAGGLIALSHVNEESADIMLSGKFMEFASIPYFKLRELEDEERADGHICPQTAREAMAGLAGLHMLVKAVPAVYEQLSAPSPAGAVR